MENLHLFPTFCIPPVSFAKSERRFGFCAHPQRMMGLRPLYILSLFTAERCTPVLNRILKRIESPIDRLIKKKSADSQYIKSKTINNNIVELSEPGSDS